MKRTSKTSKKTSKSKSKFTALGKLLGIKDPSKLKLFNRVLYLAIGLMLLGIFSLMLFVGLIYFGFFGELPVKDELIGIQNPVASEVYSEDGVIIGKFYKVNRTLAKYKDINPAVFDALIATEDARFFNHGGIDAKSLMRVIVKTIMLQDQSAGGGSTLSQQLVKNLYPRQRHWKLSTPINKIKEMIVAGRLEDIYDKDEILALYLNTVPFGEDVYGIVTASERYFSTTPKDIKIQEAAMLIGMLKAPTSYSPKTDPEKAKGRRNTVIEQMVKYGKLTTKEGDKIKKLPLDLKYNYISHSDGLAPYFRDYIRPELIKWCKKNKKRDGNNYNLYTDGLKIHTTIDSKMQQYAVEAVETHMEKLQADFFKHWGNLKPWGRNTALIDRGVKNSRRYKKMKEAGASSSSIKKAFDKPVNMKVFTHKGEIKKKMSPRDSVAYYMMFLNTGFVVTDPHSGKIKAYVGGVNHKHFEYDHARSKRQVGSTFKPIVYATALDRGEYPCAYTPNKLISYPEYQDWTPKNSDDKYGGSYSMRGALMGSVNVVSVQTILDTGPYYVVEKAKELGITSNIPELPSIALGTPDISVLEMVEAYGVFPSGGYNIPISYLNKIEDKTGRTIEKFKSNYFQRKEVFHPEDMMIMTELMQSVVDSGTARRLRWRYMLPNDIAGKTGTTQSQTDGWFMGFTPKLVAGVWVGGPDRSVRFNSIQLGQGANMALPIFGEFMSRMNKDPKFKTLMAAEFTEPNEYVADLLNCESYLPYEISTSPVATSNPFTEPEEVTNTTIQPPPTTKPRIGPKPTAKPPTTPKSKPKTTPRATPKSRTTKPKKKKKKFWDKILGKKKKN